MQVALDIGSKVVTALEATKDQRLLRFDHSLKEALEAATEIDDVTGSPQFADFLKSLNDLQAKLRKFDEPLFLHSVATGIFGNFNEAHRGLLPIELMKALEGELDFLPLIPDSRPKNYEVSHFATTIERAVCSKRSKTALSLKGNHAALYVLRGSRISIVRPSEMLGETISSSPLEAELDAMPRDINKKDFKFKEYRDEIILNLQLLRDEYNWLESVMRSNSHIPILVGKGIRELLRFKASDLMEKPGYELREKELYKIKIKKSEIPDLLKGLNAEYAKRKDDREKRDIFRAIKSLAFIGAILKLSRKNEVYLSDARYIYGLESAFEEGRETNHSMVFNGTSPFFFGTFGEYTPELQRVILLFNKLTPLNNSHSSTISRLSVQLAHIDSFLKTQGVEAADAFSRNKFPYLSTRDQELICCGAREIDTPPEDPNSLIAWAAFNISRGLLNAGFPEEHTVSRNSKQEITASIGSKYKAQNLNKRFKGREEIHGKAFGGTSFKFTK